MEVTSSQLPESYELSQSQFTQTQPQTQPDTQPAASPANLSPNLWGILISSNGDKSSNSTSHYENSNQTGAGPPRVGSDSTSDRPTAVEFEWPQYGGKLTYTIGRNPKSDVRLNSPKVSNHHARITVSEHDGLVRLEDLSTNGTFVRGMKVGKGKVTILEPGDTIIFGPTSVDFGNDFRYLFEGSPAHASRKDPYGLGELSQSGSKVFSRYEVREQIGKGSFASVRKGVRRSDGMMVAIKIIQKARFANNPKTLEMFAREIQIIQKLDHPFCVKCYDWFEDEWRIWIVLEYVDGGDLLDYTMKKKGLSERETREIALMVCQAVSYLHSQGITHRDLKPENLLLTKSHKPVCKVTDFGLAKMVTDQTMLRTMCGTPTYLAPEVILNPNPAAGYSPAVDAWSTGVVLYSLLTCQTPFDESESTPLPQRMRERHVDFDVLAAEGLSDNCIDFLKCLLIADPRARMTCAQAIDHPWLKTLPVGINGAQKLPNKTMSAYEILSSLNNHQGAGKAPFDSTDSSPIATYSKPPIAGLASAISLDQSPRPDRNEAGSEEGRDENDSVASQAIGKLRLSHLDSPASVEGSAIQMPPPKFQAPFPHASKKAVKTPHDTPAIAADTMSPLSHSTKRKEPASAFSDSSLSELSSSSLQASQPQLQGEDQLMKEGSLAGAAIVDPDECSPEAPPSLIVANTGDAVEDVKQIIATENSQRDQPEPIAKPFEKELSPISSISSLAEEEDDDEPVTPARRQSTRSRNSTSTTATVTDQTPPISSNRKPRSARTSTGRTRRVAPRIEEDDEVEQGGIAASVKNRRRKAARLT
ncbi:uncharacterized protein JCM15063_005857 [Sporobolomyces koalae]|uniref:uncharacterized protein n=1 Tax=Sporobolomyces koalae TaxID=500713 RepID=UPI003178A9CE